jgi:hypothetical protein
MGEFSTKCFYRENGVHCEGGLLVTTNVTAIPSGIHQAAVLLEGTGVYCPACEGKGVIPTAKGRELLTFLAKFGKERG